MKLKWNKRTLTHTPYYEAVARASDWKGHGYYQITIEPRPAYCDRGNWIVKITAADVESLDWQEGFPRYYFDLDRAKAEMEAWCDKRESIKKYKEQNENIQRNT